MFYDTISVEMFSSSVFFMFLCIFNVCAGKNYSEYVLYRGVPLNEDHLQFLTNLTKTFKANYWKSPGFVHTPVEFMIGPDMKKSFLRAAEEKNLSLTTVIEDVQSAFDKQTVTKYSRRNMKTFDWQSYFRLGDIYKWMKDLKEAYPKAMRIMKIGKTYEDRDILAASISHPGSIKRSTVIVEGGIHGREWIAPAVVTYFLHKIVTGPESKNKLLRKISNLYEFIVVPVLNPDGYEYTHTSDRAWRKNRAYRHGVDINRNFDAAFGTVGVSRAKTEETFCGPEAFSEKEAVAMAQVVRAKSDKLEYYFAFHSYGQYIILPYAHSKTHMENYNEMKKISDVAAERIKRQFDTKYRVGTAYDTVEYVTSGVSGCWVKKEYKVPYVATFELRDKSRYGFALPPNQILPTCKETMDGLLYMLEPKTQRFNSQKRMLTTNVSLNGALSHTTSKVTFFVKQVHLLPFGRFFKL